MNTTFFVFNIFTFISSGCSDNESFFFSVEKSPFYGHYVSFLRGNGVRFALPAFL